MPSPRAVGAAFALAVGGRGLGVDQHLGLGDLGLDRVAHLVGKLVGALEAGARAVLDVEVDVAAAAGATGAELVVAGDLGGAGGGDRLLDPVHLRVGQGFVDQHAGGAADDVDPGRDDRRGDDEGGDRVEGGGAGDL